MIDSFVGDDGKPLDGFPSMRMVFTFEAEGSGTRMVTTSYFASIEALEQVVAMGTVEGLKLAMAQLDVVLQDLRDYAQGKGTRLEKLDDTYVRITRLVDGPRELVWRAHHDADLMKKWMLGPDGWQMTECITAQATGDSYRYTWTLVGDTPSEAFGFEGEALLVEATSRSVSTEKMQGTPGPSTLNDLNLYEENGATLITLLVEYPDAETRDMILATGMIDGMEASYARLEQSILAVA